MLGWPYVFYFMGARRDCRLLDLAHGRPCAEPASALGRAELDYIERGGALVNMDPPKGTARVDSGNRPIEWGHIRQLIGDRMMIGIYLAQYCINALTYFFITWFPVYLVQQRGMSILNAGFVASIPAICGFAGGVLGGIWSDAMLRKGFSLTASRKTPIVVGMLLSTCMIICNYVDAHWVVVAVMALAFFGKGVGALGWAVVSDTVPKQIAGLSGGLFNMFGNLSSISTPIIIGYIIQNTGSFNGALVFVGANAIVAAFSYLVIVGEIKRIVLKEPGRATVEVTKCKRRNCRICAASAGSARPTCARSAIARAPCRWAMRARTFIGKPVIGIINTWSDLNPATATFRERVEDVKRGVWQAGGFPVELPAMSLSEQFVKPTTHALPQLPRDGDRGAAAPASGRRRRADGRLRQDHAGHDHGRHLDEPAGDLHAGRADDARPFRRQHPRLRLGRLEILGREGSRQHHRGSSGTTWRPASRAPPAPA